MKKYTFHFKNQLGEDKTYVTRQLNAVAAQAAFGSYCAKNKIKPQKGWYWEIF